MATASHNPPEYGGFKMVINDLEVDNKISFIPGIDLYKKIIKMELPLKDEKVKGVLIKKDVLDDHFKHIMSFINLSKIKPFKVVVDVGGGMMGEMVNRIFEKLPCELIPMFFEYDNKFSNRAPNPLDDKASDKCGQMILEKKADLGIMFDVDGDRMFLLDEKGQLITGDLTLLLMSKVLLQENPGSGIVYNLICSHAVSELVTAWGGKAIRSEVGYRNLAKHMYEEGGIMSGEVSGHFAFKDNFYADNGPLALVLSLQTVSQDGRELSEIIKEYRLYARGSEINIKVDSISDKLDLIREEYKDNILDEIDGITVEFDTWWFNIRASNTEPLLRITVEAENDTKLKQRQDEVMKVIN
jgi:phosphomannomutase